MSFEVIKVDEHTWRIEDGGVRMFLLEGDESALLIDSGMTDPNVKATAESLTSLPITLINTHVDRDHIAGNAAFPMALMHPAEAGAYHALMPSGEILPVWDGDILDLGGREVMVITIPGHTPGSIALLDISRRILFSGDSVQNGSVFMFGRYRDIFAYPHSLKKLTEYCEDFDEIYPSHSDCPLKADFLDTLIADVDAYLAGKPCPTEETERFGNKIKSVNVGCATLLVDGDLTF